MEGPTREEQGESYLRGNIEGDNWEGWGGGSFLKGRRWNYLRGDGKEATWEDGGRVTFRGLEGNTEYLGRHRRILPWEGWRATWKEWRVNNENVRGTERDLLWKDREKAT